MSDDPHKPTDPAPPAAPAPESDSSAAGLSSSPSEPPGSPEPGGYARADLALDDAAGGEDEFANLVVSAKRPRSPIVGLLVIGVAGILFSHLWPDVRFALGPKTPADLGEARALLSAPLASGLLGDNRFVAVGGAPDYRNALLFEPKGDNYRRAFYRLLGTGSRLWVRAEETSTRHDLAGPTVGRLGRFDALPYAEQVRAYYATHVKVQRLIDLDELRARLGALGGGGLSDLHDRGGEPIDLNQGFDEGPRDDKTAGGAKAATADVVVDFPDELLVTLPRLRFAVEEDARRELVRLGAPAGPVLESPQGFTFPVRFFVAPAPGATPAALTRATLESRNAYIARLEEKGWGFKLRRERYATPVAGLAAGAPGMLSIPAAPTHPAVYDVASPTALSAHPPAARLEIPWDRIDSIQIASPIRIPHDAWIVVEGELPGDFLYAPALAALLVVFAVFNVWLLLRSRRGR